MDCLVTKLKAVVNNDNLPVLNVLNDFTKEAILKSGNTGLSDDQKFALNSFFRTMGAFSNSTLWQKIDMLLLPIIGANGTPHLVVDYSGKHTMTATGYVVDQDGALETSGGAQVASIGSFASTYYLKGAGLLLSATLGTDFSSADVDINVGYKSHNIYANKNASKYSPSGDNALVAKINRSNQHPEIRYSKTVSPTTTLMLSGSEQLYSYGIDDNGNRINARNEIPIGMSNYGEMPDYYQDITEGYVGLTGASLSMIIDFNGSLSSDEVETVLTAVYHFKSAFAD